MTAAHRPRDRSPDAGELGMDFSTFFERFGGSLRTKNIDPGTGRMAVSKVRSGEPVARLRRRAGKVVAKARRDPRAAAQRFAARQGKTLARTVQPPKANRRPYRLPMRSELPVDFIRLCPWEAEYLFMLAARARRGIVETGRLRGGSTLMLACANRTVPITSIDIAPKDDAYLRDRMAAVGVGANVELVVGDSQFTSYDQVEEVDLLWIDGDHRYEGALADLRNWHGKVVAGGHVVLHDCYDGSEVQPAVLDFLRATEDVDVVRTPYVPAHYWQHPTGSLTHWVKRA